MGSVISFVNCPAQFSVVRHLHAALHLRLDGRSSGCCRAEDKSHSLAPTARTSSMNIKFVPETILTFIIVQILSNGDLLLHFPSPFEPILLTHRGFSASAPSYKTRMDEHLFIGSNIRCPQVVIESTAAGTPVLRP